MKGLTQQIVGTTAEWEAANPRLPVGVFGIEVRPDKKRLIKIGMKDPSDPNPDPRRGLTRRWKDLPYEFNGGEVVIIDDLSHDIAHVVSAHETDSRITNAVYPMAGRIDELENQKDDASHDAEHVISAHESDARITNATSQLALDIEALKQNNLGFYNSFATYAEAVDHTYPGDAVGKTIIVRADESQTGGISQYLVIAAGTGASTIQFEYEIPAGILGKAFPAYENEPLTDILQGSSQFDVANYYAGTKDTVAAFADHTAVFDLHTLDGLSRFVGTGKYITITYKGIEYGHLTEDSQTYQMGGPVLFRGFDGYTGDISGITITQPAYVTSFEDLAATIANLKDYVDQIYNVDTCRIDIKRLKDGREYVRGYISGPIVEALERKFGTELNEENKPIIKNVYLALNRYKEVNSKRVYGRVRHSKPTRFNTLDNGVIANLPNPGGWEIPCYPVTKKNGFSVDFFEIQQLKEWNWCEVANHVYWKRSVTGNRNVTLRSTERKHLINDLSLSVGLYHCPHGVQSNKGAIRLNLCPREVTLNLMWDGDTYEDKVDTLRVFVRSAERW
jgi:hypothetical protein